MVQASIRFFSAQPRFGGRPFGERHRSSAVAIDIRKPFHRRAPADECAIVEASQLHISRLEVLRFICPKAACLVFQVPV